MSKHVHNMRLGTPAAGAVNYSTFHGEWNSSEASGTQLVTVAGSYSNLRLVTTDPGAVGNSITFALRVNGVDTGLSLTFTPGDTDLSDTVTSVAVSPGDRVSLHSTPVSVPTVGNVFLALDFDSTTTKEYSYGGAQSSPTAADKWSALVGYSIATTGEGGAPTVFPIAGTITAFYVRPDVDPSPGTWVCSLYLNGVKQDGTGGTTDTRVTIAAAAVATYSAAFSLAIAAGDVVSCFFEATSSPASTRIQFGIKFVPTDEQFIAFSAHPTNVRSGSSTHFREIPTASSLWATTEAQEQVLCGITGYTIKNMYCWFSGPISAFAGYTKTQTLRVNTADSSPLLEVAVVQPAESGNASADVPIVADDLMDIQSASSSAFGQNAFLSISMACDAGASGPTDDQLGWRPTFPDALPHAPLKLQPYQVGLGVPLPGDAAIEIGWRPAFPDAIRSEREFRHLRLQPYRAGLGDPLPGDVNPAAAQWRPSYPDYLRPFEVRPLLAPQQAAILLPFARTRFYFPSSSDAVPVSPTFGTAWTRTDLADRLRLNHRPRGTAFTSVTRQMDTSTNPGFVLTRQYVSSSLHAGRIDGAIKGALRALESHSNVAGTVAVRIALCNSTGGDLREVLAVTAITPTATPPEFSTSTLTNRRFQNSAALFSVPVTTPRTVNAGDHLVVEIGFRENANQPSRNATLRVGDFLTTLDQATDDLPENETSTSDLNPWIEVSVGLEAILHWQPTFPARVPAVATAAYLQYDATVVNAEELPPAPLIWKPEYPDLLLPPARSVPDHPATARGPIRPIVVALFQWQPTFPDVIDRLDHTALRQYTTALGPQAFLPINERQWAAVYPSFLFRPPPTALYLSPIGQNIDPLANAASPELAWKPIYPDWIDPAAGLAAALYQFTDRLPRDIPDVTALSWSPTAPPQMFARPDRTAEQRVFDWQFLFPTPDLLAGLHWRSEYPSHFPVPQVTLGQVADPLSPVGPTPIDWDPLGELHPRYPPPRVMSPFTAEPPPSVQPVVAARMGWIPRYDGLLWRLVPLTAPFGGWTPEPTIGASAILCIGITDEFVTAPQLNPAALTLSDLIDEAVTTPTLLASEVC